MQFQKLNVFHTLYCKCYEGYSGCCHGFINAIPFESINLLFVSLLRVAQEDVEDLKVSDVSFW